MSYFMQVCLVPDVKLFKGIPLLNVCFYMYVSDFFGSVIVPETNKYMKLKNGQLFLMAYYPSS